MGYVHCHTVYGIETHEITTIISTRLMLRALSKCLMNKRSDMHSLVKKRETAAFFVRKALFLLNLEPRTSLVLRLFHIFAMLTVLLMFRLEAN